MVADEAWIDNSSGDSLRYGFRPPQYWREACIKAEQLRIAALIEYSKPDVRPAMPPCLRLVDQLPIGLRMAIGC